MLNLELNRSPNSHENIIPVRRDPQPVYPLHTHDFVELVIIYSGEGMHVTSEGSCPVQKGDVFFIPRNESHGFKKCNNLSVFNIMFKIEVLEFNMGELSSIPGFQALFHLEPQMRVISNRIGYLKLNDSQLRQISMTIDEMEREYKAQSYAYQTKIHSLLFDLIVFLCRSYSQDTNPGSQTFLTISRVISYLQVHYDRRVNNSELLELSGFSTSRLYRLMKETTGLGPIEFHLQHRLWGAAERLVNTSDPVSSIAQNFGFDDSNYFSRVFNKYIGMSPSMYRKTQHLKE